MKHWVIDWSNRQTAKKRCSTYHDVKYINEHGEHQFLFNQLIVPTHNRKKSKAPRLGSQPRSVSTSRWHDIRRRLPGSPRPQS